MDFSHELTRVRGAAQGMWDRRHDTQYTGLLHEKGWQGPLDKKKKKSLKDAAVEEVRSQASLQGRAFRVEG